jgi:hypothetical protein
MHSLKRIVFPLYSVSPILFILRITVDLCELHHSLSTDSNFIILNFIACPLFTRKDTNKRIKHMLSLTTYICWTVRVFLFRPVPVPLFVVHIQLAVTPLRVLKANKYGWRWILLRPLNITGSKSEQFNYWTTNITYLIIRLFTIFHGINFKSV